MAQECAGEHVEVLEKAVDVLSSLLAELGACPPMAGTCPQRGKPINISICSTCLRKWAETAAREM